MLTHLNLVHSILHYRYCLRLGAAERSVVAAPASHITGLVANLLTMLGCGGCSLILPQFEVRAFLRLAADEKMTHTLMVPAMYKLCLLCADLSDGLSAWDLSAWRVGAYGGAPMPEALIEELAGALPELVLHNVYGSTETPRRVRQCPPTAPPSTPTASAAPCPAPTFG